MQNDAVIARGEREHVITKSNNHVGDAAMVDHVSSVHNLREGVYLMRERIVHVVIDSTNNFSPGGQSCSRLILPILVM